MTKESAKFDVEYYTTSGGGIVVLDYLASMRDVRARAMIKRDIEKLAKNLGDTHPVTDHLPLQELRVDVGPGYRVYFLNLPGNIRLLLHASDKRNQRKDFITALENFEDYRRRTKKS